MKKMLVCALAALALIACDDTKTDAKKDGAKADEAASTEKKAGEGAKADEKKADEKKADDAKADAKKTDEKKDDATIEHETNPNAVGKLELVDLKGKLPEGVEVEGKVSYLQGFKDKDGLNLFVVSKIDRKDGPMMIAKAMSQNGDASWDEDRVFKQQVKDCEFDVTLEHQKGDWMITDLDADGFAEVTFAYHTGCRSDVSPVVHKVLMTSLGKKYALRGDTAVAADGKNYDAGGKFKVDDSFKSAPKGFQAHAEKVWGLTVKEKM